MVAIYLYFNATVYALFAIWCSIAVAITSRSVGFLELSRSGITEYLTVYGGLEFGIAFFFAWCARSGQHRAGVTFALLLYTPMVLFRSISVIAQWPVTTTALSVACLEVFLLAGAVAMFTRRNRAA